MPIPPLLVHAIALTVYLKYVLIFLGTPIGGPFLILASGFLLHEGYLDLVPLFLALSLGELTLDIIWYVLGYRYADRFVGRFGHFLSLTPEMLEKVKAVFARYHAATLFFNKVLMGLGMGIVVLITAGATRVPFWKYMFWNAFGEIVWVSVMLYIGYFYAGFYATVAESLRLAFLGGTVLAVLVLMYGISKYLRGRALEKF